MGRDIALLSMGRALLSHIILIRTQQTCSYSLMRHVEESTNTNFIVFGLTQSGLEPTIYRIRGEQAKHYTIDGD
jgi:hypothetical protein